MKKSGIVFLMVVVFLVGCSRKQNVDEDILNQNMYRAVYNSTENEAAVSEMENPLNGLYPEYFSGAYAKNNGKYVVYVTDDSPEILQKVHAVLGNENIEVEEVEYSMNVLVQTKDEFESWLKKDNEEYISKILPRIVGYQINVAENAFVVYVTKLTEKEKEELCDYFSYLKGIEFEIGYSAEKV